MKIKTILGAISLALTLNSAHAGGIYRYYDEDLHRAYQAEQAYKQAKNQYKLMQARAKNYKRLALYHKKATKYTRAYESQDSRTFDSEARVWESGVNVEPLYRPSLDFSQLKGKIIRGY